MNKVDDLNKKKIIEQEKDLAKKIKLDEKKILIKQKKNSKILDTNLSKQDSSTFNNIVKNIIERNISKPYPDINVIPD